MNKDYTKKLREFIERDFKIKTIFRAKKIIFFVNDHKIVIKPWANGTLDNEQTCGYMVYLEDVYYCFYGYGVYEYKGMSLNAFIKFYNNFLKVELSKIVDNYYKLIPKNLTIKQRMGCGAGVKKYIEEDEDSEEEYSEEENTDEN